MVQWDSNMVIPTQRLKYKGGRARAQSPTATCKGICMCVYG